MSIVYHVIKVVGPPNVQAAVQDSLQNNEDERWSDVRIGLDYARVPADKMKDYIKQQERENANINATGFRSVQIEEEEIRARGRVGAAAKAANEARGLVSNGATVESPETSSPRRRGRPARTATTYDEEESGDESDGEPVAKKPVASSTGRGRGRPPKGNKTPEVVKKVGGTGKRGRPSKAAIAAKAADTSVDMDNDEEEEQVADEVETTGEIQEEEEEE